MLVYFRGSFQNLRRSAGSARHLYIVSLGTASPTPGWNTFLSSLPCNELQLKCKQRIFQNVNCYSFDTIKIYLLLQKKLLFACKCQLEVLESNTLHWSVLRMLHFLDAECTLKCPYDQIVDIHFFYIFVYNMTFLYILPNFNPLRTLEVIFFTFISKNLRLPLLCSTAWLRIRENDVKGSKIPQGLKLE